MAINIAAGARFYPLDLTIFGIPRWGAFPISKAYFSGYFSPSAGTTHACSTGIGTGTRPVPPPPKLLPHALHCCPAHLLDQELGRHKAGQAEGQVQVQVVEGAAVGHKSPKLL